MSKNEKVTQEYLSEQLSLEQQRLTACQENLQVHKEILASVMGNDQEALKRAAKHIDSLTNTIKKKDETIDQYLAQILVYK